MSLVALTLSMARKSSNPDEFPSIPTPIRKIRKREDGGPYRYLVAMWSMLQLMWNTLVGCTLLLATIFFLKDTVTTLRSGKADERSPKRNAYRLVSRDDIKFVKNEMNTTVNDVIVGLTNAVLSRYLHDVYGSVSPKRDFHMKKLRLRGIVAVNVREAITIQDPLEYVRKEKLVINKKKLVAGSKALILCVGCWSKITCAEVEEIDFCCHRVAYIAPTGRNASGHPPVCILTLFANTIMLQFTFSCRVASTYILTANAWHDLVYIQYAYITTFLAKLVVHLAMEKSLSLRIRTKAPTTSKRGNGQENTTDNGVQDYQEDETEQEEPLSPFARLYHTPRLNACIVVILGFATTVDVDVLKAHFVKYLSQHRRFSSKLALFGIDSDFCLGKHEAKEFDGEKGKKPRWALTKVNLDDHVIVPDVDPDTKNLDRFIENYGTDLSSRPFDLSKPLWEFHVLKIKTSNAEAIGFFKVHHSLGDAMSLVALTLSMSRKSSNPDEFPSIPTPIRKIQKSGDGGPYRYLVSIWLMLQLIWNTLVGFTLLLASIFFLKDTDTPLRSKKVDEHSPKRIAYRLVSLDDIKFVKNEMNMTVNDVIVGLTNAALSRYLHDVYEEGTTRAKRVFHMKKLRLRAIVAVNDLVDMVEKGSKCRWGNVAGCILIPFHVNTEKDPLEYVRRAKLLIDRKKLSLEAKLSYYVVAGGVKLLSLKMIEAIIYRVLCNMTLMFSNVVGPVEEIDFCGHRVAYIAPTARNGSGHPPGLVMHLMSYMNKMSVAVCVNQDLIPDPHKLLDDFEQSLDLMKKAAVQRKGQFRT
ncbi:Wax ester synthase/diacylglycerol acyltransferase 11-like protein [Drosera capensis]